MGYFTRITWLVVSLNNRVSRTRLTYSRHLAMGNCCHYAILWVVRLENGDKYKMTWKIFPWLERVEVKQE